MRKNQSRPNILFITADQLPASIIGAYGHPIVKTPNIDRLAENGVLFSSCYTNSPLCAPARASLYSGQFVSRIGVYDNGCEFASQTPTFVHHLRNAGYKTILSGKAHFIGPDQLHGFEQRLTTDIYPASFAWSPSWDKGVTLNEGANIEPIKDSGTCSWNLQMDYDEEAQYRAIECLRQQARRLEAGKSEPFFLSVGYTHPHDPFIVTPDWWDLYDHREIDLPAVEKEPTETMHPFNQWLQKHHGIGVFPLEQEEILNARHAFYGMTSYLDSLIGALVSELKRLGLYENTLIMFTSDHGEMLGEHGMWYKRTFFEESVRVPMIVHCPKRIATGKTVEQVVSLVDIFPTLCEIGQGEEFIPSCERIDGSSFARLLYGEDPGWKDEAISEYCGEGVLQPMRLVRKGDFKYVSMGNLPPLLFDLRKDPHESDNLSGRTEFSKIESDLRARVLAGWNEEGMVERIRSSQRNRVLLNRALNRGRRHGWDWTPPADPDGQYVRRDAQIDNEAARYPRVDRG